MTFLTDEIGLDTRNPIELYRFVGSLGVYTYSSSNREITFNTEVYQKATVSRSEIVLGDVTEKNEVKVVIPITAEVVKVYGFDIPPPELTLEIYRMHGADGVPQLWFVGTVNAITMENGKANFVIPSVFSAYMQQEFPNVYYQAPCNHVLFSERCGVSRTAFTLLGTVTSLPSRVNLVIPIAATRPDQWLRAGELVSAGSERRLIIDHVGSAVVLNYPFRRLTAGSAVTLFAGCDHKSKTCNDKFNNVVNNLGFELTPGLNPFVTGLR